jgi:hypothetical protein
MWRSTPSLATGFAPFEVHIGRTPGQPLQPVPEQATFSWSAPLSNLRKEALHQTQLSHTARKEPRPFTVGNAVYVYRKTQRKWVPGTIVRGTSRARTFWVRLPSGMLTQRNCSQLKPRVTFSDRTPPTERSRSASFTDGRKTDETRRRPTEPDGPDHPLRTAAEPMPPSRRPCVRTPPGPHADESPDWGPSRSPVGPQSATHRTPGPNLGQIALCPNDTRPDPGRPSPPLPTEMDSPRARPTARRPHAPPARPLDFGTSRAGRTQRPTEKARATTWASVVSRRAPPTTDPETGPPSNDAPMTD